MLTSKTEVDPTNEGFEAATKKRFECLKHTGEWLDFLCVCFYVFNKFNGGLCHVMSYVPLKINRFLGAIAGEASKKAGVQKLAECWGLPTEQG